MRLEISNSTGCLNDYFFQMLCLLYFPGEKFSVSAGKHSEDEPFARFVLTGDDGRFLCCCTVQSGDARASANVELCAGDMLGETDDEYGFLPYFMNNDPSDFANQQIQGSPSKQVMLDGQVASEKEQAAAKEFLNWIVYSEIGQQMLVYTCNLIPPFQNNPYEPTDPLSRNIYEKVQSGEAFNASAIVPNDHWSVLGAAMQKYLAGRSDRDELIESIEDYWAEQE